MESNYLYKNYFEAGLNFSKEIITNYCLALYTKPFVIISGISGTGKTKIAQLFQPYIEETVSDNIEEVIEKDYINLTVTKGILNEDGRGNFKQDDLRLLLSQKEYSDYEEEKEQQKKKGTADNFKNMYNIILVDDENNEYKVQFYVQRAQSPLIRVRFKSKRGDSEKYDLQPYLKNNYKVNDVIQLKKIDEKKFKIIKINRDESNVSTNDSKIKTYDDNICFIPVKSDWTDSTGIMGFYNIIENKFHIGPLLKHLLFAIENPDVPFFVILDEMNLSKIEYYLSDILSIMETRVLNEKTEEIIVKEKITLSSSLAANDYISTDDEYFDLIPAKIHIPTNFYITGTINVDETTYTPSMKVLDRANVIDFNEVDLEEYFNNINIKDESKFVLKKIPDFTKPQIPSKKISELLQSDIKNMIIRINNILSKYNLHFGYRVAGEISLYIMNVKEYVNDSNEDIMKKALDYQISQKVLIKMTGNQSKIEKAIVELFNLLTNESIDIENIDAPKILNFDHKNSIYPLTIKKIKSIYSKLYFYGFASGLE